MKILLTGATGFLGSHLAKKFVDSGYEVTGTCREQTIFSRVEAVKNRIRWFNLDRDRLDALMGPFDVIIHAATLYGRRETLSTDLLQANVLFPLSLLQCAERWGCSTFINTDTYFNRGVVYSHLPDYVLSKRHFIEWAQGLGARRGVKLLSLRIEHLYGPGDDADKFVPGMLSACRNDVPVLEVTAGEQKRDFIFIDDVVDAYVKVIENHKKIEKSSQIFQVGWEKSVSIRQFLETVKNITLSKTQIVYGAIPYRPDEIMDSYANSEELRSLGWRPQIELHDGLKRMLQF